MLDQAGNPFTTTVATNVVWTIKNNGTTTITVNDGTDKILAAGATATYTTVSTVGAAADTTIDITSIDAKKVDVNAKATGATASDLALYFYDGIFAIGVPATTFTGTVVALDEVGQWVVLSTAVGNIVVDYTLGTATTYTVDGSSATIAAFESNLTVGDTLIASQDATDGTYALTNH